MTKYKYICAGNLILDSKGMEESFPGCKEYPGGPATFAYTGVRLWTDSVLQVSRTGKDFQASFGDWFYRNRVQMEGISVVCDRANHLYGFRHAYGFGSAPEFDRYTLDAWQDFGYQKIRPEDIGRFTERGGTKGVYLASNPDTVFWGELADLKSRHGFKIMWEIEGVWAYPAYLDLVRNAARFADIFSINLAETQSLFNVHSDEECIAALRTLPVEMTLFRVGERGLYVVTSEEALYLPPAPGPVVDTVGCGNTSTGAAMYAYCEGMEPLMVGILANVASARNIRQYGLIPDFDETRERSLEQARILYRQYRGNAT